ncbi:MAG: diaminopimelate epimerase, partial [Gammaproteobacteria bacterium]|nr:diaminopimelate epimerase [Gammaproteobacteria bacterium]
MRLPFTKMHGLGNDFAVIDCVSQPRALSAQQIAQLADRHLGIGFDQLLQIEPAQGNSADFRYRIFNGDGSEVEHCG